MANVVRKALWGLRHEDGRLVCQDGTIFDVAAYSQFKYGELETARAYGIALAQMFVSEFRELANDPHRVLVTSAPYKYLPTASHAIATAFMFALNCYRITRQLEPTMMLHTVRFKVGTDRYAMAGPEERKLLFSQTPRHVDTGLVKGSIVISVDDVKITGATESRLHRVLVAHDPLAICYLHVATMADPEFASTNAGIEDVMNKAFPNNLASIEKNIVANCFQLNSRVFRTMLENAETGREAFYHFLLRRSDAFIEEMYGALVGGTAELYSRPAVAVGKEILERVARERKLLVSAFIGSTNSLLVPASK